MAKTCTVTAVFRNRFDASAAYDYVMGKGYVRDEVNVMMSNSTREAFEHENKHDVGTMATEGVAAGGAIGTAVGAAAAAIAAAAAPTAVPIAPPAATPSVAIEPTGCLPSCSNASRVLLDIITFTSSRV